MGRSAPPAPAPSTGTHTIPPWSQDPRPTRRQLTRLVSGCAGLPEQYGGHPYLIASARSASRVRRSSSLFPSWPPAAVRRGPVGSLQILPGYNDRGVRCRSDRGCARSAWDAPPRAWECAGDRRRAHLHFRHIGWRDTGRQPGTAAPLGLHYDFHSADRGRDQRPGNAPPGGAEPFGHLLPGRLFHSFPPI